MPGQFYLSHLCLFPLLLRLAELGASTVGELRKLSLAKLQSTLGVKTGQQLFRMARGKDERKVQVDHVRKTVSAEVNYGIRFSSWREAETFLGQLSDEVAERLQKVGKRGRSITLKLMVRADGAAEETSKFLGHGVCDNLSRSSQLLTGTDSADTILREVISLAKAGGIEPDRWRGVGVSVARLDDKGEANQSLLKFLTKGKKEVGEKRENKSMDNPHLISIKPKVKSLTEDPKLQNDFYEDGEERPDPSFLAALPPDLRAEVEAQFAPKSGEAHELYRMLEQNGPHESLKISQSNASVERKGLSSVESETSTSKNLKPMASASPNCTEVDPQFMAEMPADIREELEEHQRERKRTKEMEELESKQRKINEIESVSPAEASFSQLDPEVLMT